ncbi:hypothetical protein CLV96_0285 [Leptospira meyeri]|uniref:Uncharacterized protein n=1 Tax=Leptospira meyeri TaxID=29508 RepID=A0A4R8MQ78_LEPME|nr:hypothetical protein [Leptospira meyeri]EKJ85078.1 hypothetical protein LEP1GSC017_3685 [Leptospira meyeri serovar Hardjo str. Went 5]TDY71323.1 hypothetical protein CLV96_0285 [Leptospira meyeri]
MPEDSEKKSNLIEDVIKSRLSHPFIGTFIASFTFKNFDILLILFTKLNKNDIYYGLECFKSSLWNDEWRVSLPILVTIFVPFVIEPLINLFHQKTLAVVRRWTKNWIEREEIKVITDDHRRLIQLVENKENEINRIKDTFAKRWEQMLKYTFETHSAGNVNHSENFCYIFKSNINLKKGDLVGYSKNDHKIYIFTKDNVYAGKVLSRLDEGYYLVFYDKTFTNEFKEIIASSQKYSVSFYSYKYKRFVSSLEGEDIPNISVIQANRAGNGYKVDQVEYLDADFRNQYLKELPEYFEDSKVKKEISRNWLIVDFWIYLKYHISKLKNAIRNKLKIPV